MRARKQTILSESQLNHPQSPNNVNEYRRRNRKMRFEEVKNYSLDLVEDRDQSLALSEQIL